MKSNAGKKEIDAEGVAILGESLRQLEIRNNILHIIERLKTVESAVIALNELTRDKQK